MLQFKSKVTNSKKIYFVITANGELVNFNQLIINGGLPRCFRAFFGSAKQKNSAGVRRKKSAKKAKAPSAKEQNLNSHLSLFLPHYDRPVLAVLS
jgi:hypothetical protein